MRGLRYRPDLCSHGVARDHQADAVRQRPDQTIAQVWRCSECRAEDIWGPGWRFFGTIECVRCWRPVVERVQCPGCAGEETRA